MAMATRLVMTLVLWTGLAGMCRADRLHLRNGQVKIGKLVKKDEQVVDFRISLQGGKVSMVKRYRVDQVTKIEIDDETEAATAGDRSAERRTSGSLAEIQDKPAFLKQALEKLKAKKAGPAVRDLTRLVNACKDNKDELAELSEICQKQAGKPLDVLLAASRLEAAMDSDRGRLGRLNATTYERRAMVDALRKTIDRSRGRTVAGTTIDDEIDAPDEYESDRQDAKVFGKHVAVTLRLIKELERLDPSLKSKPKSAKRRDAKDRHADPPKESRDEPGDKTKKSDPDKGDAETDTDRADPEAPSSRDRPDDLASFHTRLVALDKAVRRVARSRQSSKKPPAKDDDDRDAKDEPDRERAPAFEVVDLRGRPLRLADFDGKVVLLDFWSTSDPDRAKMLEVLGEVFRSLEQHRGFVMVSLSADGDIEAPRRFVAENRIGWIQGYLAGPQGEQVKEAYGVRQGPAVFVIDHKGCIFADRLRGDRIMTAVNDALRGAEEDRPARRGNRTGRRGASRGRARHDRATNDRPPPDERDADAEERRDPRGRDDDR